MNPGLIIGGEAGSGEMECIMRWYETHHFMKESGEIDLTASPAIVTKILDGMDIISLGDFAITNQNGQTTFSFRIPSSQTIEFK